MPIDAPSPADGLPPSPEGGISFGHFVVPCRADGSPWELGRGAMGVTYRAFDTSLRTEVALKVINAARVQEESVRRRFQRKARAAAKIRHPNVASVLYLGERGGEFFYAMEFIEGRSLDSLLKETAGPLPVAVATGLAAQVAAGLNAAHKREVVHRDLKPANLMLLEGDSLDHEDERTEMAGKRQLKIIDFGLARSFGAGREEESLLTQTLAGFIGTPAYASPEQCAGEGDLDGRSDLYSLGIILWQMLAGRLPFTGNWQQVLAKHQYQEPPFAHLENLPAPLIELLAGLLIKDPAERRPQTAGELRSALDRLLRAQENTPADNPGTAELFAEEAPADTTEEPSIGTTLCARYRLGQEMGSGDGGRLFLAADNADDQQCVAIKLLPPERAADPDFLEKTARALDLAARHPHPAILAHAPEMETSGAATFYVREWAEGFSLLELLRQRGSLRAAEVFRLLDALPEALDFATDAGFPLLEPSLHKLFVTPLIAGNAEDLPGWRSRPVEGWPAFALRLNPLSFPPAINSAAELTRLESRSASDGSDPVMALARLTRELLGGAPGSLAPLSALSGEANAVMRRTLGPAGGKGAFKSCAVFWDSLRAAAGLNIAPPLAKQETLVEPVPLPLPPLAAAIEGGVPAPESAAKSQGKKLLLSGLGLLLLIAVIVGVWKQAHPAYPASPVNLPKVSPLPTNADALNQQEFQSLLAQARERMAAAEWREAVEAYSQVLALAPNSLEALDERGTAYDAQSESDKAKTDYARAILLEPANAREHYYRGDAYASLGYPEKAEPDYQTAVTLEAHDAHDFRLRGRAYNALMKYDLAIKDFDEAIRLNPQFARAFYNRGIAYCDLKQYDLAIKDFDEAIRLNPKFADAFTGRGIIYNRLEKYDQAIKNFDESIRLDSQDKNAFLYRGNAFCELQKYDLAVKDYDEAIRLNPKFADAFNGRGNAYNWLHKYDQAVKDLDEAIRLNPKFADAFNSRGNAYLGLQKYDLAIKDFDEAIRLDPKFRPAYLNRATAKRALGQVEEAKKDEAMARALEMP
jgi:serine/threonine protein kinase/tetratricopeptide (TPR) repeat protein